MYKYRQGVIGVGLGIGGGGCLWRRGKRETGLWVLLQHSSVEKCNGTLYIALSNTHFSCLQIRMS